MSSNKKHGLGRGLDALLGEDSLDFDIESINTESIINNGIKTVKIDDLYPSKYQPRTEFNQEALNALVTSIREKGVLQPLLVRKDGDRYEIIAGERRWRASKEAGLIEVPVIEKDFDNQEVLEVALIENLLRENLSAIEEAEGFERLINEFSHTHEALSEIVGKSRSYITNSLRLLNLPLSIKELIKTNALTAGHARCLVGLENAELIANKIVDKKLSVRETETLVNNIKNKKNETNAEKFKKDINIKEIEKDITKTIGMKVLIKCKDQNQGKLTIEYKNPSELDSILKLLERK